MLRKSNELLVQHFYVDFWIRVDKSKRSFKQLDVVL